MASFLVPYRIITAEDQEYQKAFVKLEGLVNTFIEMGYRPVGGVRMGKTNEYGNGEPYHVAAQAMLLRSAP